MVVVGLVVVGRVDQAAAGTGAETGRDRSVGFVELAEPVAGLVAVGARSVPVRGRWRRESTESKLTAFCEWPSYLRYTFVPSAFLRSYRRRKFGEEVAEGGDGMVRR